MAADPTPAEDYSGPEPSLEALKRPFGSISRQELLDHFFSNGEVDSRTAWVAVYRLLLWIDPTTGLAHCYESDKSQQGRHWYPKTLEFHSWVSRSMGLDPGELGEQIDWLFRAVLERLALSEAVKIDKGVEIGAEQRAKYPPTMPQPYEDPELKLLLEEQLSDGAFDGEEQLQALVRDIRRYVATENKRKNLLGEGFEDVLAAILRRLESGPPEVVETQKLVQEIDGFREPRDGEKAVKVDLWLRSAKGRRTLVTAKWSVRADREKQLADDYRIYVEAERSGETFDYVFVTNEFDAARLVSACDRTEMNRHIFDTVVHVCPEALLAAHGFAGDKDAPPEPPRAAGSDAKEAAKQRRSAARLPELVASGRLISLADWLDGVSHPD
jgi:hypothetical protein